MFKWWLSLGSCRQTGDFVVKQTWSAKYHQFFIFMATHKKPNIKTSVLTTFVWQGLDKVHGFACDWIWLQLGLWIGLVQQYIKHDGHSLTPCNWNLVASWTSSIIYFMTKTQP